MTFLDRYLAKYSPVPRWGTGKTDDSPPRKTGVPPGEALTKLTKPGFVSNVSNSRGEKPGFWGLARPQSARAVVRRRAACKACRPDSDCRTCEETSRRGWFASHRCRLPRRLWTVEPKEPPEGVPEAGA